MKKVILLFVAVVGFAVMSNNVSGQTKATSENAVVKTEQTTTTPISSVDNNKKSCDKHEAKNGKGCCGKHVGKANCDGKEKAKANCDGKGKGKCCGHEKGNAKDCKNHKGCKHGQADKDNAVPAK